MNHESNRSLLSPRHISGDGFRQSTWSASDSPRAILQNDDPNQKGSHRSRRSVGSVGNDIPRPVSVLKGEVKGRFGSTEYEIVNPKAARVGNLFQLKDKEGNLYAAKPCDKIAQKQFKREAMQYFHMDPHQNVLTITDIAHVLHEQQDIKLLVVPWATIGNLQACMSLCVISLSLRIDLCRQIGKGLQHLHHLNPPMIHQNLKPQNVLMFIEEDKLVAKITDFGIMASGVSGIKLVSPPGSIADDKEFESKLSSSRRGSSGSRHRSLSRSKHGKPNRTSRKPSVPPLTSPSTSKSRGKQTRTSRKAKNSPRGYNLRTPRNTEHEDSNYWASPEQRPGNTSLNNFVLN